MILVGVGGCNSLPILRYLFPEIDLFDLSLDVQLSFDWLPKVKTTFLKINNN